MPWIFIRINYVLLRRIIIVVVVVVAVRGREKVVVEVEEGANENKIKGGRGFGHLKHEGFGEFGAIVF